MPDASGARDQATTSGLTTVLSARGGLGYLAIHALQFGVQPELTRRCVAESTSPTSLVLAAEIVKIVGCGAVLQAEGRIREAFQDWTLLGFAQAAGLPSVTYVLQNLCIQLAYKRIDGVSFNVLNQSKMLFTALAGYVFLRRSQSPIQCVALLCVAAAGVLVSTAGSTDAHAGHQPFLGALCAASAAALSGLGSALVERSLCEHGRDSCVLSAEMAVLGCTVLLGGLLIKRMAGTKDETPPLFASWTRWTFVPVLTQGLGGIVVGYVTKFAGGVRKGFAVTFGLILTCLLRLLVTGDPLPPAVLAAVPLAIISIYLHAAYPVIPVKASSLL